MREAWFKLIAGVKPWRQMGMVAVRRASDVRRDQLFEGPMLGCIPKGGPDILSTNTNFKHVYDNHFTRNPNLGLFRQRPSPYLYPAGSVESEVLNVVKSSSGYFYSFQICKRLVCKRIAPKLRYVWAVWNCEYNRRVRQALRKFSQICNI